MHGVQIKNGDIITFTALQWRENGEKGISPCVLTSPVLHVYEDDIEPETVIDEALLDARIGGRLEDMFSRRFVKSHELNRRLLKHRAKKAKKYGGEYRVLTATYRFRRGVNGEFECERNS